MAGQEGFEPSTNKLRASTHQRSSECTVAIPGLATGPRNATCPISVYRDCGENEGCVVQPATDMMQDRFHT
jgi:hypothetical protein